MLERSTGSRRRRVVIVVAAAAAVLLLTWGQLADDAILRALGTGFLAAGGSTALRAWLARRRPTGSAERSAG